MQSAGKVGKERAFASFSALLMNQKNHTLPVSAKTLVFRCLERAREERGNPAVLAGSSLTLLSGKHFPIKDRFCQDKNLFKATFPQFFIILTSYFLILIYSSRRVGLEESAGVRVIIHFFPSRFICYIVPAVAPEYPPLPVHTILYSP